MSTQTLECRVIHRHGATHDDRLTLLVAVLAWAETSGITLRQFHSRFSPQGEFSFTVHARQPEVIDRLLASLPVYAVEDVTINGKSRKLPPPQM
jgi:hypothetical protein